MSKPKLKTPQYEPGKHVAPQPTKADPDGEPPRFSLRYLSGKYCLSACEKNEKAALADTIHTLSKTPWRELRQAGRHGIGYERLPTGEISLKSPMALRPDVSHYIVFRFSGKKPMVGHKDADGTFYVFWLDRDFTLYDHGS